MSDDFKGIYIEMLKHSGRLMRDILGQWVILGPHNVKCILSHQDRDLVYRKYGVFE